MDPKRLHLYQTSRIEQLPDDVLVVILSFLSTLSEIARTSILCRRFRYVWCKVSCLDFDAAALLSTDPLLGCCDQYVEWVTNVIRARDSAVKLKQLQISCLLKKNQRRHIDRWISFAAANPLESLHLDLHGTRSVVLPDQQYTLRVKPWLRTPTGLSNIKCLKSLYLSCVNVRQKFISFIISTCQLLEDLTIILPGTCKVLDISGDPPPPRLRRLAIEADRGFALTKLRAPHLTSFYCKSFVFNPLQVDVPMLTDLAIGADHRLMPKIWKFLEHFESYLPQLEKLELMMDQPNRFNVKRIPELVNLKYLKLHFYSDTDPILHQIVNLINACPFLETFAIEIFAVEVDGGYGIHDLLPPRKCNKKQGGCKHECCVFECLKVFEIHGGFGETLDQDIVKFVVSKSPRLEKLIVCEQGTFGLRKVDGLESDPNFLQLAESKTKKLCQGRCIDIEILK